ncbi:MAG: hypothetical protein JWQ17_7116, partial [Tardiphaga sp.]|nr:hypothetical protein [Tardiphaga sp.]
MAANETWACSFVFPHRFLTEKETFAMSATKILWGQITVV